MGDPFFDLRDRSRGRNEARRDDFGSFGQQLRQDVVSFAVRHDYLDPFVGHLHRDSAFGQHTSAAELRFPGADVLRQVVALRADLPQYARCGVCRVAVVDAVDVAEDNQRLDVHHRGDQARQLVVVGEHQFRQRDRVVLVDDRDHAVFEHHRHAVLLVQVVAPRRKVLFGRQHLSAGDAVFAEQLVVVVDQLHLSDGRKELAGRNGIQFPLRLQLVASRCDGPRRHENHLDACAVQRGELVGQRRHPRRVERPVRAGQHVAAYLYDNPFESV